MRINSKEELQSKKAKIEQNIQSFTCRVLVCSGTGCIASGAQKIYEEIYTLCLNMEGMMEMFSKELEILDRNTVKLMIDELDEALGEEREKVKAIKQERETLKAEKESLEAEKELIRLRAELEKLRK